MPDALPADPQDGQVASARADGPAESDREQAVGSERAGEGERAGAETSSNPFATRWTRPGALDYIYPAGETPLSLITRLVSSGGRGQIMGPHGTGKTSLLRSLRPHLEAAGYQLEWHDPQTVIKAGRRTSNTLVVIDGYEQLGRWSRLRLWCSCWWHGCGLLVTTHEDLGLPVLVETSPSLDLAQQLAERLLADRLLGGRRELLGDEEWDGLWREKRGNLREVWFALYDRYESRRRLGASRT
ncbi:MAG: hypothetical protein ACKOBW_16315 [Planctomycetota bacterium]